MDLITGAWRQAPTNAVALRAKSLASAVAAGTATDSGSAVNLFATEDYSGLGSVAGWRHTPTVQTPTASDPRNPTSNTLTAIRWGNYVLTAEEIAALAQVGVIQTDVMVPATYSPPQGASLGFI